MAQVRIGGENSSIYLGLIKIGLQKSVSPLKAVARVSKIIQNIKIMILELATTLLQREKKGKKRRAVSSNFEVTKLKKLL